MEEKVGLAEMAPLSSVGIGQMVVTAEIVVMFIIKSNTNAVLSSLVFSGTEVMVLRGEISMAQMGHTGMMARPVRMVNADLLLRV
jgi:hypothetical protein